MLTWFLRRHNYKTLSCAILLAFASLNRVFTNFNLTPSLFLSVEMLQTPDEAEAQVLHHYVSRAVDNLSTWKDSSVSKILLYRNSLPDSESSDNLPQRRECPALPSSQEE